MMKYGYLWRVADQHVGSFDLVPGEIRRATLSHPPHLLLARARLDRLLVIRSARQRTERGREEVRSDVDLRAAVLEARGEEALGDDRDVVLARLLDGGTVQRLIGSDQVRRLPMR